MFPIRSAVAPPSSGSARTGETESTTTLLPPNHGTIARSRKGTAMLRGLYSAATGMEAAANAHEVTSRNLAHASVPGFRKALMNFEAMHNPWATKPDEDLSGAQVNMPSVDFTPGPINRTGAPLDFALDGEGFFVVNGPDGPLYTRAGTFELNGEGKLVTPDGFTVRAAGGEIEFPANMVASKIVVGPDGTVRVGREEVGQLEIMKFADPNKLLSVGATLFQAPPEAVPEPSEARVVQGAREMSNVSPVNELVNLIAAQRHYEMAQKAASAIDRTAQKRIDLN